LRKIKISSLFIFTGFTVLLFFVSCSTQKNTFTNRTFHSITTKYNGYFNARESYRAGVKRLSVVHEDNYENVLSIFPYGGEQSAAAVAGNMDVAYQKASTAIRRHSMNIRGVEYNKWIDDCFYLIARSHFFKRDYNLSVLTFEYIIRQFETPLKYKSMVWVAKSYSFAGQYENAQQAFDRVARNEQEGLLDNETKLLFNMAYADYHLRRENFNQAANYLERATNLSRNRNQRARLTFILAQAYHRDQNFAKAQQSYARVLKMNPDFQMAFQARINMAMAFDVKSGDSGFILSELKGMLKDNKNREFRDQIYYALAQFSMRQQKENEAIEYYNLALENHRGNDSQKGLSFLRLGEIYFNRKDYLNAALWYDSTMVYISREYDNITEVSSRNTILKELASHIRVVNREDSLQRLAALNPNERNAILDKILADIEEQARIEREKEQERARMRQDMARRGTRPATGDETEGGWYFYNPSAMSFGQNEFYAKWGERNLEDLWRISNKRVMAFGEMDGFEDEGEEAAQLEGGRVTRASLMENLPTTPEKMKASNERMAKAFYSKGLIYKNRLEDFPNAVKSLESLVTRFPENENVLYGAYFLVTLFEQQGNQPRAQVYKNMIIERYPDTDYARIFSDPNYAENIRARQNQAKVLYEDAFNAYSNGNYDLAVQLCEQSASLDLTQEQAGQFSFLKAMATGKNVSRREFRQQLTYITENYQGTKVHEPATNLLAYLGQGAITDFGPDDQEDEIETVTQPQGGDFDWDNQSVFSYNPEGVHFFIIIANTRNIQVRQLRNQINLFNQASYSESNLNMSTLFFDEGRQLLTITNFPSAAEAMKYGNELIRSENLREFDNEYIKGFAISVENYPVFYQERKLDDYLLFYNATYQRN
jgi:tetratricopeptide (TPR) repeat protein